MDPKRRHVDTPEELEGREVAHECFAMRIFPTHEKTRRWHLD